MRCLSRSKSSPMAAIILLSQTTNSGPQFPGEDGGWARKLVALRCAGARGLAETETGSARTSERNRARVARRGSSIAPWFPQQVAEKKMRAARNPNCRTSGAEWKDQELDQDL